MEGLHACGCVFYMVHIKEHCSLGWGILQWGRWAAGTKQGGSNSSRLLPALNLAGCPHFSNLLLPSPVNAVVFLCSVCVQSAEKGGEIGAFLPPPPSFFFQLTIWKALIKLHIFYYVGITSELLTRKLYLLSPVDGEREKRGEKEEKKKERKKDKKADRMRWRTNKKKKKAKRKKHQ